MQNILSSILAKRGIKDKSELTKEERKDFDNWQRILEEEEVTIASLSEFIEGEIVQVQNEFKDLDRTPEKTERLALKLSIYSTIQEVLTSKKNEREALIEYLTTLL